MHMLDKIKTKFCPQQDTVQRHPDQTASMTRALVSQLDSKLYNDRYSVTDKVCYVFMKRERVLGNIRVRHVSVEK